MSFDSNLHSVNDYKYIIFKGSETFGHSKLSLTIIVPVLFLAVFSVDRGSQKN